MLEANLHSVLEATGGMEVQVDEGIIGRNMSNEVGRRVAGEH